MCQMVGPSSSVFCIYIEDFPLTCCCWRRSLHTVEFSPSFPCHSMAADVGGPVGFYWPFQQLPKELWWVLDVAKRSCSQGTQHDQLQHCQWVSALTECEQPHSLLRGVHVCMPITVICPQSKCVSKRESFISCLTPSRDSQWRPAGYFSFLSLLLILSSGISKQFLLLLPVAAKSIAH